MISKGLVSIIVPTYNGEKYIGKCIDSIIKQDYKNIEIIIVNDGSTDNTKNIIGKYKEIDDRIIIINKQNGGVSSARNKGIDSCSGEYICFVDSDDMLAKNYVSYLMKLAIDNHADIVTTLQPIKFSGDLIPESIDVSDDKIDVVLGEKATVDILDYKHHIGSYCKLIKTSVVFNNNLRFNEKLSFGEGFNFTIDCFQKSNIIVCSKAKLYYYRLDNPNSVMTKFSVRQIEGNIEAIKLIQKKLSYDLKYNKHCDYAYWHTCCDCLNSIIGTSNHNKVKQLYKSIYKDVRKYALSVFKVPVPKIDKIKGIMYLVNPFITSKIINHFRIRKFTKES